MKKEPGPVWLERIDDDALATRLERAWGRPPRVVVWTPGRVNLIGEHTDYNDGWALPTTLGRGVQLAAAPCDDARVTVRSSTLGATASVDVDGGGARGPFALALSGVVAAYRDAFGATPSIVCEVAADLPPGAGLSSSAASNLGLLEALAAIDERTIPPEILIRLAREAEWRGTGVRCGALDPMAIVCAEEGAATLLDLRALTARAIPCRLERCELVVIDSGIPRRLAETGYNDRRTGCEQASERLTRAGFGEVVALRDVSTERLEEALRLVSTEQQRWVRHVVTENARVLEAARILSGGEGGEVAARLGALIDASHASLRDDYAVSLPPIDALLDDVRERGALGARIMGAGFGGVAIALWPSAKLGDPAAVLAPALEAHKGRCGASGRLIRLGGALGARRRVVRLRS